MIVAHTCADTQAGEGRPPLSPPLPPHPAITATTAAVSPYREPPTLTLPLDASVWARVNPYASAILVTVFLLIASFDHGVVLRFAPGLFPADIFGG